MPSELTSQDVAEIVRESDLRSGPVRRNFTALKNKLNEAIRALAAAAIGTTNAETTAARPYHTSIGDRLDSMWKGQANYVKYGGVVSINADPQKVDVTAGEAKVDGADVKWNAATSGTIAYTVSNTRYDVVVINSDNTLTVVTGSESANPVLPAIASTQKPLWVLTIGTASVALSHDARDQGCWYFHDGALKYSWKIQDAIDDVTNADIYIGKGKYYEEVDLSGKNNIALIYENGALHYRISDTAYCIKSDNDSGSETVNTKIIGGKFYGNGKAGTCELLYMQYADQIAILDCYFDGNASSSATYKNILFDYCDYVSYRGTKAVNGVYGFTNCTHYTNETIKYENTPGGNIALGTSWGQVGSAQITLTEGKWLISYKLGLYMITAGDVPMVTVSTTTNSETYTDSTQFNYTQAGDQLITPVFCQFYVQINSTTTFYLLGMHGLGTAYVSSLSSHVLQAQRLDL